jgi:hypothetical protein
MLLNGWLRFHAAVLASAVMLSSCAGQKDPPFAVVALCDLSASIEPEARTSMFQALESTVKTLRRGDSFAVIPINGDADVETPGHVLRFALPAEREVYDEDLRRVNASVQGALKELTARAMNSPGSHTDIIGALRAASEELAGLPREQSKAVLVLSDFIQDDTRLDFETDPRLASKAAAEEFAAKLAKQEGHRFENVSVFLGYVRSRDLARLSYSRREAIQAFWLKYLGLIGAQTEMVIDGPGLLPRFLADVRAGENGPASPSGQAR